MSCSYVHQSSDTHRDAHRRGLPFTPRPSKHEGLQSSSRRAHYGLQRAVLTLVREKRYRREKKEVKHTRPQPCPPRYSCSQRGSRGPGHCPGRTLASTSPADAAVHSYSCLAAVFGSPGMKNIYLLGRDSSVSGRNSDWANTYNSPRAFNDTILWPLYVDTGAL